MGRPAVPAPRHERSLDLALEVASYFGVAGRVAREVCGEVSAAVRGWRKEAARHGIGSAEIERMESAFEHEDAAFAATL
jgi:serine/threonine-protein kinase HipA